MYNNIPDEMKTYNQWIVWRFEDTEGSSKPTKVPYSARTGKHARTNDPSSWGTYAEAITAAQNINLYSGIGFVLAETDPYVFIDLDNPYLKKPDGSYVNKNADEIMDSQLKIFNSFVSYAEKSPSGTGLHIIVKGSIPSGRKRGCIEIYSDGRFMTMTGNVYRDEPINDCHMLVNSLYDQMSKGPAASMFYAGLTEAALTDAEVIEMANNAANAEKFHDLYYDGNWQKYYASQSEADLALVDIIAFYSENRQQVRTLWLQSALAKRDKGHRVDYIKYMLNKCFDHMLPPIDVEGLRNNVNEQLERNAKELAKLTIANAQEYSKSSPIPAAEVVQVDMPAPNKDVYSVPVGLVGEIAQYIYMQSVRPVPEVALVAALGFMSGIVGRAYNISGTGLNQYILLLAPTGTGKEAIARGIGKLINCIIQGVPSAEAFVGPGEVASSQALIKYLSKTSNSFVSIVGEFGIALSQMGSPNAPPHLIGLRRLMLDLYNKSGEGDVLQPSIYSDREKNTTPVQSPNYTIIGESTPEKFYEALHEGMISEGLLPRFTTVEYLGHRPPRNEGHEFVQPSYDLINKLNHLCSYALTLNSQNKAINVALSPEAKQLMDLFDKQCDLQINSTSKEVKKHLWNRAHIKALKLAALIAVGCHIYDPVITAEIAQWAINLVIADATNFLLKFDSGEVGVDNDETKQMVSVVSVIKDYLTKPWSDIVKYVGEDGNRLHGDRIVSYAYIQRRLCSTAIFRKDRIGSTGAIKRALKTLTERGDLQECAKPLLSKEYGTSALCFAIKNSKVFLS